MLGHSGSVRAFLENADLTPEIALFGTDGVMTMLGQRGFYRDPDGVRITTNPRKLDALLRTYLSRQVRPWLEARLEAQAYRIINWIKKHDRAMFYWGARATK